MKPLAVLVLLTSFCSIENYAMANTNTVLLSTGQPNNANVSGDWTIELHEAPFDKVIALYADCSGRTILLHPFLPTPSLSVHAAATNRAERAKVLEALLATNRIVIIPDGDRFVMVVPKSYANRARPRSAQIVHAAAGAPDASSVLPVRQSIPKGGVILKGAELLLVAEFYAKLVSREITPPGLVSPLLKVRVSFSNQTVLTTSELIYAYETLLEFGQVKLVPEGGSFLKPERHAPQ